MDTEIIEDLVDPIVDPTPDPAPDPKEAARKGFEQRTLQKRLEDTTRELEGYKRRDEEKRKADLTETQRLKEELDGYKAAAEQATARSMREKVAREYKLPDAFVSRLVGSDEESLRADAEEMSKHLPRAKVGTTSDPVREAPVSGAKTYKESQLADNAFFRAHEADIMKASREGRITRGE